MLYIIANAPIGEPDKMLVEQIFVKYYRSMMYVANSILKDHNLAEDAVSDALLKIIKHREKLRNVSCQQTRAYIVNIVRTTSFDVIRKNKIREHETDDLLEELPDESINIEDEAVSQDGCASVMAVFRELPEIYKEIAYHFFVFERSHEEISKILGISVAASQKRLSRARAIIKKTLEGDRCGA